MKDGCLAYARDEIRLYPGSKPKKEKPEKTTWMLILEDAEGRILLERRPPSGIWGGLGACPNWTRPMAQMNCRTPVPGSWG